MHLIEAALAFAAIMIVLSTAVTGFTESYLRITAVRPTSLVRMVRQFVQEDPWLKPKVDALTSTAKPSTAVIEEAVDTLTENPTTKHRFDWWNKILRLISRDGATRIDRLSTYGFFQRLARTDIGKKLVEDAKADALRGIVMGYERYVATSNELFRKRSQAITMGLSLALVFAINVDAVRLFQHLMESPETRSRLIAEISEIEEENRETAGRLARLYEVLETNGDLSSEVPGDGEQNELTVAANQLRTTLERLDKEGTLPIGHAMAPYRDRCDDFWTRQLRDSVDGCARILDILVWVGGVALAGFLVGLGGPFWYKFYSGLAALVQLPRSQSTRQELITGSPEPAQPGSQRLVAALNDRENGDERLLELFKDAAGP